MDNEKKPEFLKKILEKNGNKAVNENPALDEKKILAPLKEQSTTLPTEKEKPHQIVKSRADDGAFSRGRGGSEGSSEPKVEGEKKTPTQKILDRGEQKPWGGRSGGSGGRGGAPMIKEPDEILKEKNDALNPEDILSKNKVEKTFEIALNESPVKTTDAEMPKKKSSFMASLDAQIDKAIKNKEKGEDQKSKPEPEKHKGKGILAEIEKKVEAVEKSGVKKSEQKLPTKEVTKQPQIKPTKSDK